MIDDETPPTTRYLLERIAQTLDVPPAYFFRVESTPADPSGPSIAQCEEAASLFRAIRSPTRRGAVLKLLREMAADS
ncbi:hypothetical protein [Methylobacterium pseudosasicola]|uniref:Uncharacterized protein n=1 Tax=Methylobacterium pseudosasicola TaxID=582667 RepID=A0A1I4JRZ5_9HYPH|nr:hypothetical protein [Methylobacterium pseudosasicola]SFL69003.1 hypothetical protein SAMN05192568_1008202 [Methylobacterium pseudosasicola]